MHIGIVTCEILRSEIAAVIEKSGVENVFFVLPEFEPETCSLALNITSKRMNARFSSEAKTKTGRRTKRRTKLKIKEKTIAGIKREIRERRIRNSVIVKVLDLRMHDYPDKLLAEVAGWVKKMSSVLGVDFVLLGYGLCGSTAREVERVVVDEAEVPVVIPRDGGGGDSGRDSGGGGEILNNCVEIALGRERVRELLQEEVGTFFMTPAGASIIKEPQVILESSINIRAGRLNRSATCAATDTPKIVKLMKNHYRRVVKICYSDADEKDREYSKTVEKFAKKFGLEVKVERGSARIMLAAFEEALQP